MLLEDVINNQVDSYYKLCQNAIIFLSFGEDEPNVSTSIAIKSVNGDNLMELEGDTYKTIWWESISFEEWENKKMYDSLPYANWTAF